VSASSTTPTYIIPESWVRSMVPPHGVQMETFTIHDMPTLIVYRRPAWHLVAVAVLATVLSSGIGFLAAQHRRLDDIATRWQRVGSVDGGTATAASSELREGPGGSGEAASK